MLRARRIADDKRGLIERLLVERIALRGMCRAVGVTLKGLLGFVVQCFAALPDHLHVQPVSYQHNVMIQRLEVAADAMASFVKKKANKQWMWIAMDAKTRQVIALHGLCRKCSFTAHWEYARSVITQDKEGETMISFKGAHFPQDIILTGIRWYMAYPLSYRHIEELMQECGFAPAACAAHAMLA